MAFSAPGRGSALLRMVYKPLADGSVRQIGTVSNDQGKTWQPEYDYTYRRK
jgi:translation elongation factor P/translation initiation factor 5A